MLIVSYTRPFLLTCPVTLILVGQFNQRAFIEQWQRWNLKNGHDHGPENLRWEMTVIR